MERPELPVIVALLLAAGPAVAEERPWKVSGEIGTDCPIDVDARIGAEAPWRLRGSTSIGILTGPYVDLVNVVVVAVGGYDDATADLVRSALESSLVWRTHVGWRPFRSLGLYADVGYGLVALGGAASTEQIVVAATGADPPDDAGGSRTYDLGATLHMIDAEIGWQWWWHSGWTLRAALGFAGTLAASASVEPNFQPLLPRPVERFTTFAEDYLVDTFTSYVFTPVVTVAVGWRLL